MRNVAWMCVAALLLAAVVRGDTSTPVPVKQIPLDTIYATSGQKELKTVETGPFLEAAKAPAVAAFAWGKDFKALTKESLIPATGTEEKPQTLTPPADAEAQLWAIVYFGSTGSNPLQFIIKSVTWPKDGQVSVAFERAGSGVMTMDLKPYVAWIPLGKVASGKYALQLVAAGKMEAEQKWTVAAGLTKTGPGEKLVIPDPSSVTISGVQIIVEIHVPADQAAYRGHR